MEQREEEHRQAERKRKTPEEPASPSFLRSFNSQSHAEPFVARGQYITSRRHPLPSQGARPPLPEEVWLLAPHSTAERAAAPGRHRLGSPRGFVLHANSLLVLFLSPLHAGDAGKR